MTQQGSFSFSPLTLRIASRSSYLARAQVQEFVTALRAYHPHVQPHVTYVKTHGDLDLNQSLRHMGKSDFFTREVDELVVKGVCDVALHSAKDLPELMPEGLVCMALTRCVDSTDSLVLRSGVTLEELSSGARIAVSSVRREESVRKLRNDVTFIDIRGTIQDRLAYLEKGLAEGVVVARAALIRLGLDHLNQVILPGETTPLQGQLAVIAKAKREDLRELCVCLDVRE